jgi:hypothetical protein
MYIHSRFVCKLLALAVCATAVQLSAALAVDNIRYVGITGVNTNACTLAAPCRTLQRGINATPAGGELRILDSGDYGNVTNIGRSMTISGNGNTVILANPIVIDKVQVVVALRGLTLDGQGTVVNGIRIDAAGAVHIERSVIHGFTGAGISVTAAGVDVFVLDSISRDNGGEGLIINAGPLSKLTVDDSSFENNGGSGLRIASGNAAIHRSTASGNAGIGMFVSGDASISVMSTVAAQNAGAGILVSGGVVSVDSSVSRGNGDDGLSVGFSSIARISNSTFTANATGINNIGGTVQTRQNNTVAGNGNNLAGNALTPIGGI